MRKPHNQTSKMRTVDCIIPLYNLQYLRYMKATHIFYICIFIVQEDATIQEFF